MEKIKELKKWVEEIVPYGRNKKDFMIETESAEPKDDKRKYETRYNVKFYTHKSKYYVYATESKDGHSYLGAGSSLRKPYPGEDWTRGHDLPDGPLNRKTWESIKDAIIKDEMVILSKHIRNLPDKSAEVAVVTVSEKEIKE